MTDRIQNVEREDEEDIADDNPAFVNMDDVVEVRVLDNDEPMEDVTTEQEYGNITEVRIEEKEVKEMAKIVLQSHNDSVYCIASHFDKFSGILYTISGGGDDKAFLHKIGNETTTLLLSHKHDDSVSCAAFNLSYVSGDLSKTPRYAAIGGYDGAIVIYDPLSGTKMQELEGPNDVEFVSFHPKGGSVLLAGSSDDGTIWMYHLPTSKCMQVFVGHESGVAAGCFTPDGRLVLSCGSDGTLRVWAPRSGLSKFVFRLGDKKSGLTCMATNDVTDNQLVIVGAEDGMAYICHISGLKVIASLQHSEKIENQKNEEEMVAPTSVEAVGFAPSKINLNWCATGGVDGNLKIWDLNGNGQCRHLCRHIINENDPAKMSAVTRLKWHATHPIIFTSASDGIIRIWNAKDGELINKLTGHSDLINDLNIEATEDRTILVSGSDDKSVRIFEIDSLTNVSH